MGADHLGWCGCRPISHQEFANFLLGDKRLRELLMRHHANVLTPEFWQAPQRAVPRFHILRRRRSTC